jgi:hypothetical protein
MFASLGEAEMTKIGVVWAATIAAVLSVAPKAHATLTWVQEPGLATDIGVAANDMPWIVDINGVVQYGAPTQGCSGGICVSGSDVTWHVLAGTMAHVAVSLDNVPFATNAKGEVWFPQMFADGNCHPANSWMSDFDQWYGLPLYDYAGGPQAATGQFALMALGAEPSCQTVFFVPGTMFGISSSDSSVQKTTPSIYLCDDNGHFPEFCAANPYRVNTGGVGKEVTLFSEVSGSLLTQTPWVVTNNGQLWFFNGSWLQVEGPAWSNGQPVAGGVTYATDSWVVAGNTVWAWLAGANAERRTGNSAQDYDEIVHAPPSATIAKIAVAGAYPALGWAGSRIWALDTANRIYVLEDLAVVK